jgi:hypothetical protein
MPLPPKVTPVPTAEAVDEAKEEMEARVLGGTMSLRAEMRS